MKCPLCGAKMVNGQVCRYCHTTIDQAINASNKEVIKAKKEGRHDDVCYSQVMPKDVDEKKLFMYTLFLGLVGIGNFFVGKNAKGIFCAVSFGFNILTSVLYIMVVEYAMFEFALINSSFMLSAVLMGVNFIMWVADIFNLIRHKYKVPVVLQSRKSAGKNYKRK